jgi:hypothetical protein
MTAEDIRELHDQITSFDAIEVIADDMRRLSSGGATKQTVGLHSQDRPFDILIPVSSGSLPLRLKGRESSAAPVKTRTHRGRPPQSANEGSSMKKLAPILASFFMPLMVAEARDRPNQMVGIDWATRGYASENIKKNSSNVQFIRCGLHTSMEATFCVPSSPCWVHADRRFRWVHGQAF